MSYQLRATPRRDATEVPIIDALEARGCVVKKLSDKGMPDLLVLVPEMNGRVPFVALLEVKTAKGKLRPAQEKFFDLIRGRRLPVYLVRTPEQALALLGFSIIGGTA